ncbi:DUF2357 domain-containing protein [Sporosarcina sp. E16_3]|uniref:DUF2357 domain-containing protein n=1 Tax=Sporosarcina sp. E16_3 TaxID=2789293 RepID=UPI001A91D9E0|nr:DUF2357 domain-containing protein [Sporosarcina sp. E16_3]MBO0601987.1 DUF2357 domain-containing protein [Sporosarcina sp. E16_3]
MVIPFKFIIEEKLKKPYGKDEEIINDYSGCFSEDPYFESLTKDKMISITENRDIKMIFSGNNLGARLYIDTLDYYQGAICKEDEEGNIFIEESEDPIQLFKNSFDRENITSYYPFIPGTYRIYVLCGEKKYYAYLNVEPKQVSKQELSIMKSELEEMIENLAHVLVSNASAAQDKSNLDNNASIANQMLLLSQNYDKLVVLIDQIKNSPRSKLKKIYYLEEASKVRIIDHETIKHRLKYPDVQKRMFVPERIVSHDLPENQTIVQSIKYLLKISRLSIDYLNKVEPMIEKEKQELMGKSGNPNHFYSGRQESDNLVKRHSEQLDWIKQQRIIMTKLTNAFVLFLRSDWITEIKVRPNHSPGLHLDARYRTLYQLSRELKNMKKKIQLDSNYAYAWKRTDKIYEMWCFIRIIKALQTNKLGFKPISGWIYGNSEMLESWKVPMLEEGTKITFQNDENRIIQLVYDQAIPNKWMNTSFDNPVYTEFPNNRPDARLDYYVNGIYEASFVMDFKYRPASAIGTVSEYSKNGYAYKQLLHYSKFDSTFVGETKDYAPSKRKSRAANPVPEVWVLYPVAESKNTSVTRENQWLTKVPYSPNESLEKIENLIISGIDNL